MPTPITSELLALYDLQVRRNTSPDGSGSLVEWSPTFVRWMANEGLGWSEIAWSQFDEATADAAITAQIDFFKQRGQSFVWRVHDYDQPHDLSARLLHAGFSRSGSSTVLVARASSFTHPVELPPGTEMLRVADANDVDLLITIHEAVFEHSHEDLRRSILARLEKAPPELEMFVVTANGAPLSAARIEFLPNRDFATLWGGGTLAQWRGRGIYKALVVERAHAAVARGYEYLSVLASEQSRPILRRLGFEVITTLTTYSWTPSHGVTN